MNCVFLGRCKLTATEIYDANLHFLKELSLYNSTSISNLTFLKSVPMLKKLSLNGLSNFEFDSNAFADVPNLRELSLNGIMVLKYKCTIIILIF